MNDRLRKRMSKAQEGGFTLIELLIVIVILGILAAIVVFAVGAARSDSVANSCKADIKTINTAQEAYKAKYSSYTSIATLQSTGFIKDIPSTAEYTIAWDGSKATGTKSAANGGGAC